MVDFLRLGYLSSRGRGSETGSGIPTSWGIVMLVLNSTRAWYIDILQQTHHLGEKSGNRFFSNPHNSQTGSGNTT